ncbi:MAG: methionyl-tRNA formyltransferase [bacterium]|nr:methionyl-tRNA formyltransferase [bacterium]
MKIIFLGTSEFASHILERLVHNGARPSLVVTTPDAPAGRSLKPSPSPVKVASQKLRLPCMQPEKLNKEAVARIKEENPDLLILAAYGKILPKELLEVPKKGALNIHPSLLPKFRGPSPVQSFLLSEEEETGVTLMLMDEEVDHGPVIVQKICKVEGRPTAEELKNQLAEVGADLLIETLPLWIEGKIEAKEQKHKEATYTTSFEREDGRIDWEKPAEYIERQVRALYPWPGTSAEHETGGIKVLSSRIQESEGEPGTIFKTSSGELGVYCLKDALVVEKLQPANRNPMPSRDFLLGHKEIIGTKFK